MAKRTTPSPVDVSIHTSAELAALLKADKKLAGANIRCYGEFEDIRSISTGIATLDGICGGGVPRSRFCVFSGKEGGGKTTAALCTAASFQRRGGIVMYADPERKLDYSWAKRNGVKLEDLIITRPSTLEKAFETVERAVRSCDPAVPFLFVLDSVNATITKEQKEAEYGAKLYAPQQRAFSESIPKIVEYIEQGGATFLMISQLRAKMDATVTIAGGNAVRFYSILIVVFEARGKIAGDGRKVWEVLKEREGRPVPGGLLVTGIDCKLTTIKNQKAPPFQESVMRIDFRTGLDREWCLLRRAVEVRAVHVKGSWSHFGKAKWQGERGFRKLVAKRPAVLSAIRKAIRKAQ